MARPGFLAAFAGLAVAACASGPPPPPPYLYQGLESNFTPPGSGLSVVALLSPTIRQGDKLIIQGSPYQLSLEVVAAQSQLRDPASCQVTASNVQLVAASRRIPFAAARLTAPLSPPEAGSAYASGWLLSSGAPIELDFQGHDLDLDLAVPNACLGRAYQSHVRVHFSPVERSGQALNGAPDQSRLIVGQPVLIP